MSNDDDFRKISNCIGLLASMVRGGEQHSEVSEQMMSEAFECLERQKTRKLYACDRADKCSNNICRHRQPHERRSSCAYTSPCPEEGGRCVQRGDEK